LLGNAIKFTQQGEVVLRVKTESRTENDAVLHFSITDTGIGIAEERQKAVFDAFTQADNSMTRRFGGTGLGLTISSSLVRMMGGRIWVESVEGKGSTFHFTASLGLGKTPATKLSFPASMDLRNLRVLVVDDNATNRRILDEMLMGWQMKPMLVTGGREALVALKLATGAGAPFPLVLTDLQMPEMDGFALAERIQENPDLAGATIMMLTSAGTRGDAARCRELGISGYLTKPVIQSDLLDAVKTALAKRPREIEPPVLVTRHSLRETRRILRVLVAEDNAVNQTLAVRLLEKRGHTVVVANNGREALAVLEKAGFTGFDVVLMDVQMPEMDGFEATAAIREKEKTGGHHLPIIALTAHAMKGDEERCRAAGMDAYVSKPILPDQLFRVIEDLLNPSGEPAVSAAAHPFPAEKLDAMSVMNRVDGDLDFLKTLIETFWDECPRMMADLRNAVDHQSAAALSNAAHALKGAVANFGETSVLQAAAELEARGRRGSLEGAEELLSDLEAGLLGLKPALVALQKAS